ncbi:hypothetical protein RI129_002942 [Pyrocoelia pectoralis]|uniref:Regulatory protein zeste n=1 Tax=Pyrocoelia pectoralis TaxID=417401 RepID=A0AAN7ZIA1_9COLE
MDNQNKRAHNFSACEEKKLIDLVKQNKSILENKLSNTDLNKKNTSGKTFRSSQTLKKKYENIKKRTKQKFADEKCYVKGTGGGPPREIQIDEIDLDVREILGTRIDGLPSKFDDDVMEKEELIYQISPSKPLTFYSEHLSIRRSVPIKHWVQMHPRNTNTKLVRLMGTIERFQQSNEQYRKLYTIECRVARYLITINRRLRIKI